MVSPRFFLVLWLATIQYSKTSSMGINTQRNWLLGLMSILLGIMTSCSSSDSQSFTQKVPEVVDFNWHVKPILSDRCYTCHGPDEKVREAGLRLDLKESAFEPLGDKKDRFALIPGDPDNSHLIRRIRSTNPESIMPPPASNLSLSEYEVEVLTKWVEQGAKWKEHWSFLPPQSKEVEYSKDSWANNEIDYFTKKVMSEQGLKPEAKASKGKLLRRVSFDLTGLPPTLDELALYESDDSENAFEKRVDALLDTEAFGERMASIWLDAARYADSHGYQDDRPRTMWPWRDWVINAYNTNIPFDSFLIKQIAGDLLPHASYDDKLATGFNRNHAITQEGGVVNEEYVTEYVADRMQTFSTAFLGLTVECARCHDHKYDPISQKDYYQLFAFFNTIEERGQVNYFDLSPKPHIRMQDEEYESQLASIDSLIDGLESQLAQSNAQNHAAFQKWLPSHKKPSLKDVEPTLTAHHTLDKVDNLQTSNGVNPQNPGKMNTGLIGEVAEPSLKKGIRGQALEFDGENFLNLGDLADAEYYEHFSYGAWIKVTKNLSKDAGILVKRNGEQKRGGHQLVMSKNRALSASLIHNHGAKLLLQVESLNKIQLNKWTHVFMTYDGSGKAEGIKLYLNGKRQKTKTLFETLNKGSILNGNDLLAGNWTHRKRTRQEIMGFEGGVMDEIRVYNKTLSPLEVAAIAEEVLGKVNNSTEDIFAHYTGNIDPDFITIQEKLDSLRPLHRDLPYIMVMQEMDSVRASYILDRGAYDAPTERVYPNTPAYLIEYSERFPKNRLGLAKWMTDPQHPLTSRVAVNRIWQMLFGRGIVNTPEDFGNQGALPSHPELLDWLAVDFVENGWDIKALIKKIVLSATYQQSSYIDPAKRAKDIDNVYLARGPVNRLSSEMIRDNALAISGLLYDKTGGPWVKPYQPRGVWKELANQIGENKYRVSKGSDVYRRSLYSYWKRTIPPPSMLTFDAAERTVCVVKRQSTSTPLQSLVLLNDPQYIESSKMLAYRMIMASENDLREQLSLGFKMTNSRAPSKAEIEVLESLYETEYQRFKKLPEEAESLLEVGQHKPFVKLDQAQHAAMTVVANMLLNLDEAKMKS